MKIQILSSILVNALVVGCAFQANTPAASTPVRTPPAAQTGTLAGRVNIGPLQPVARSDVPPPPVPPEVYAARSINVFAADGKTLVTNVKINPDGTYSVALAPGTYSIDVARNGLDRGRGSPKTIAIEAGKTVQLDIDIDTGIR